MKYKNPETAYVIECLPQWVELYESGIDAPAIAHRYNVDKATIYRRLRETDVAIRSKSIAKLGERNPNWKKSVKYDALHQWVKSRLTKPVECPNCQLSKKLDLANISPKYTVETYTRNLKNWEYLCRRCHMLKDGRLEKLHPSKDKGGENGS